MLENLVCMFSINCIGTALKKYFYLYRYYSTLILFTLKIIAEIYHWNEENEECILVIYNGGKWPQYKFSI